MVCKEDVVSWFKELESYKRIDAMCTLLNMCLPFELRFIGTYLEELGKRDFQELRGAELRANNPTDLAADIGGANTDPRTRRKMALYVSLLRSCNFACATTLYNAMVSLEQSGLLKGLYGDLLEEILLLYTMALHHPAFTFDQKSHFGEILDKLKLEDQRIHYHQEQEHIHAPPSSSLMQSSVSTNVSMPPPSLPNLGPPPPIMFVKSPSTQVPGSSSDSVRDMNSPPVITGGGSVMPLLNEMPHPPPGLPMPQYNMEYMGQHPWIAQAIIMPPLNQQIEVMNYVGGGGGGGGGGGSGGGSPPSSRSGSPPPPGPRAGSPLPPAPRSPPADPHPHNLVAPPHHTHLAATFDNLTIGEMRRMEDERLREMGVPHSAVQQLRSIEKLNGVRRRSAGGVCCRSSSSSGSSGAPSPPGTPLPPAPRRPPAPPPPPYLYPRYPAFPPPAYRPPPPPFANGEPPPYPGAGPYPGFPVPVLYAPPAPPAPPKLSCWNCGGAGHAGHECKEPSMEEMTRAGRYQLDFGTAGPPPEPADSK